MDREVATKPCTRIAFGRNAWNRRRVNRATEAWSAVRDGVGFVANADNAHLLSADVAARARALAADVIAGRIEVPSQ